MSTITVVMGDDRKLQGFTEQDRAALAKFEKKKDSLEPGELMWFSTWFERSGPFHRRHMKMLQVVFEAQESFGDFFQFRKWTEVGAGHGEFMEAAGKLAFIPKSIAYDKLDQAEMEDVHRRVKDFLRSAYALDKLWGHLSNDQRYEMIETLIGGFG